jgi:UrcA family protein
MDGSQLKTTAPQSQTNNLGNIMTRTVIRAAIGILAVTSIGSIALADDMGSITVQATRIISEKTVGKTSSGIPILDVSLSYGVSAKGIDLASHAGVMELEKRVNDAAVAACKELGEKYPEATPKDKECAKDAAARAMPKVNELVAAAAKKK